ncbi:MAG: AAA family ATPase [bacterium]
MTDKIDNYSNNAISDDTLKELIDLYVNQRPTPSFFEKVDKFVGSLLIDDNENKKNEPFRENISNLNFLFLEAKKIQSVLLEYKNFNNDFKFKETIVRDLIALSSLCRAGSNKSISEEELLFLSMVLIPLNPGNVNDKVLHIFESGSFPVESKPILMEYWNKVSDHLKSINIDFKNNLLSSLSYLQEYDQGHGTFHFDKIASLFYTFSQCMMKADGIITKEEEEKLKKIRALIYSKKGDLKAEKGLAEEETLETVMKKIDKLVGMENIKAEIKTFINLIKIQKEREIRKLPVPPLSLHTVFYGPPGTGKTTIARLLGKVYKCLGLLKKGHIIETDRAGLVAGYVGQTAAQVDEIVKNALEGILFIDEAYTLSPENGQNDFGQEAIDTLLKRMEDYRDQLVVIVAGYPDEMKRFIYSNPGLKSRFSRYFYFDHYTPDELIRIFNIFCQNGVFKLDPEAGKKLLDLLTDYYQHRDKTFGNGRLARNIFEKIIEKQANRIAAIVPLNDQILCTITKSDIPEKEELSF